MNHVKYMVARVLKGESLKVNMNDYVQHNFPDAFELATTVCDHLSHALHKPLEELEIVYLAMHIERVSMADVKKYWKNGQKQVKKHWKNGQKQSKKCWKNGQTYLRDKKKHGILRI